MQINLTQPDTLREQKIINFIYSTLETYSKKEFRKDKCKAMYMLREDCRSMIKLCRKIPSLKDTIIRLKFYIKRFEWTWYSAVELAYIMQDVVEILVPDLED